MNVIKKLSDIVFRIEKVLAVILGTAMFLSLFLGFLFRYVFSSPLLWSNEVAIFSLIWLTLIGASMGVKTGQTAMITMFVDRFRGSNAYKWMIVTSFFILIIFAVYILYLSYNWLSSPNIYVQSSGSMGLPMIYPYLSVPVGFLFLLIHATSKFIEAWKDPESGV